MAWHPPKTTWENNDIFDTSIDYDRLRGNIGFLRDLAKDFYPLPPAEPMNDVSIQEFPSPSWLNAIVNNTDTLGKKTINPSSFLEMARYKGNAPGWDADALNRIEGNHQLLYGMFKGTIELLPKLSFEIGGSEF